MGPNIAYLTNGFILLLFKIDSLCCLRCVSSFMPVVLVGVLDGLVDLQAVQEVVFIRVVSTAKRFT